MIIFGTNARMKTVGSGQFFCPTCRQTRDYELKHAKRYFTLYFVPLIPMGDLGEFVVCQTCGMSFKPEVLKLQPPKSQPNLADMLNSVKADLEGGQPVEYIIRDLVAAGLERDMAKTIVSNTIGERRKVCKSCGLTYAPNRDTCTECNQTLSEVTV